jgi:hypothetical protein
MLQPVASNETGTKTKEEPLMMLPPTALPPSMRQFVDPPPRFAPVHDTQPEPVSAPRRSSLRALVSRLPWKRERGSRTYNEPAGEPPCRMPACAWASPDR